MPGWLQGVTTVLKNAKTLANLKDVHWSFSSLSQEHIHKHVQEHVKAAHREGFPAGIYTAGAQPGQAPSPEQGKRLCSSGCRMLCSSVLTTPHCEHRAEAAEQGPCKFTPCLCVLIGKTDAQGVLWSIMERSAVLNPGKQPNTGSNSALNLSVPCISHKGGLPQHIQTHPLCSILQSHTDQQMKNSWDRVADPSAQSILR